MSRKTIMTMIQIRRHRIARRTAQNDPFPKSMVIPSMVRTDGPEHPGSTRKNSTVATTSASSR